MMCQVLRCQQNPDQVININSPDAPLMEMVVCKDHFDAIESGEQWITDPGSTDELHTLPEVILMGDDLAARDLRVGTNVTTIRAASLTGSIETNERIVIETEVVGSGQRGRIEILATPEFVKKLGVAVWWLGGNYEGPDSSDQTPAGPER